MLLMMEVLGLNYKCALYLSLKCQQLRGQTLAVRTGVSEDLYSLVMAGVQG